MYRIRFSYKFRNSDKIWEYESFYATKDIMEINKEKITRRYGMYDRFKISVEEI